jgi:hypothetical protein
MNIPNLFLAITTGETIGGIVAVTAWLLLPWAGVGRVR